MKLRMFVGRVLAEVIGVTLGAVCTVFVLFALALWPHEITPEACLAAIAGVWVWYAASNAYFRGWKIGMQPDRGPIDCDNPTCPKGCK